MDETNWQRLWAIVESRRERLGMTRTYIQDQGGPSSEWVRKLRNGEGRPSLKQAGKFVSLDRALGWPEGTSWDFLTADRTGWSAERLAEEESALAGGEVRHLQPQPPRLVPLPPRETDEPSSQSTPSPLARAVINSVCDSTASGWLYYCDEHDTHGNADSREEAEWMADAHVSFYVDQEEGESDPCQVIVWSRKQGPANMLAE